ncbi:MAG: ribokinase, partial [Desulfuromonadales bacterium]|nr:ribokinase [Desulfuromonadales bacterium]
IGSSNMDLVAKSPRIPVKGETILGDDFFTVPGGKGANQAVAAAKLGNEVCLVAKLGTDMFAQQSLDNFQKVGVDTEYITQTEKAPSGTALIIVDSEGNNCIVVVPGANHELCNQDLEAAKSMIQSSGAVVCQLEIPISTVEFAAELAVKNNVPFILDPAPAPTQKLPAQLLAKVDILTPNETEAEILSGIKVKDEQSASEACKVLLGYGVKTVILTMGSKGFLLATGEEEVLVPQIKVDAVDSTAAGDAFTGSLACFVAQGKPIIEAAKLANYVAALSVTKMGAQPSMPTRESVNDFIKKVAE